MTVIQSQLLFYLFQIYNCPDNQVRMHQRNVMWSFTYSFIKSLAINWGLIIWLNKI